MADGIRNHTGWREWLGSLRGSTIDFDLRRFDPSLDRITRESARLEALDDRALDREAARLRSPVEPGAREALRVRTFSIAREAARRELGLRPFDEQIVAALAMDEGAIVEVQTGEGKTLAAVLPAALNALGGRGVHVLTFNDYLARRDAEWMGPIFRRLGLSVGVVQQDMPPAERRRAYASDVTYVTAKEAGFDYLRDQLALDVADIVHRPFHFALVDEADSILIDEARSPLVIAGRVGSRAAASGAAAAAVAQLDAGFHYVTDEYGRDVELTDAGIHAIENRFQCGPLHELNNLTLLTEINCALHARVLLRRDVDYLVRDGRIQMVDELTGRVVPDRQWPDGLQAALEAKEGLAARDDGRILGSVTLQHFLRGYPRLCGMTGTAQPAASELAGTYGLPVVVVPTHRPMIRDDRPDAVFAHRATKERAIVAEITSAHAAGRPVLVGTSTVEESEHLAGLLRADGIACEVLNARHDAAEARIVAGAGRLGAVTIATNMAGRGTDIRLGGPDDEGGGHDAVAALGGLYVIGTNRHESRRIDQQLRGRAGRQGDPGESRFFVSLEDDLLVRYGIEQLLGDRFTPGDSHQPIDHPVVLREVARAQRIVEGQNFEIRRTLCKYADAVESQRLDVMDRRQRLLDGRDRPDIWRTEARYDALVAAVGEAALERAERVATLRAIDRAWRDHLALVAELREGVHLVTLGGRDPLTHFREQITAGFTAMDDAVDEDVREALARLDVTDGRIREDQASAPASTWTYLVSDDPFRHQIGMMLTGSGRTTFAIGAAAVAMPLLILWGAIDNTIGRRVRAASAKRRQRREP